MVSLVITTIATLILLVLGLGALALEVHYRRRPGNQLAMSHGDWQIDTANPHQYLLTGYLELVNQTQRFEIMIPEVSATVQLLSKESLDQTTWAAQILSDHPDAPARSDGYWFAYIVKRKPTYLKVIVKIQGDHLAALKSAWIQIQYVTYGPQGRIPKVRHVVIPLQYPDTSSLPQARSTDVAEVFPIQTHLLTELDDPVAVVKQYILPHAQPGDVVTLGETPLALIQGRFRHPTSIHPGWVAQRVCLFFLPTSSLATACGMQSLIDVVGSGRVLWAFGVGFVAKLLGKPGMFYQLAGEQARLIDDVTGTLPPFDQFVVLGPEHPQQVVDTIERETGLAAAIVDVNDLKAVKILAATPNLSPAFLEQALRSNPAGNADEQTPLVLIRPRSQDMES